MDRLRELMGDFAGIDIYGMEAVRWAGALLLAAAVFTALRLVRWVILARLSRLSEKTQTRIDDILIALVRKTRSLFFFVVALVAGATLLDMPEGWDVGLRRIFSIALFIQIGAWVNFALTTAVDLYLQARGDDEDAPRMAVVGLFNFFARVIVWTVVVLLILDNFGVDVTTLIAGLGVGGIAIGLALQSVLKDTFASLSIILDKPFQVGDFVVIDTLQGTVERIGIKTTRVRSISGEELVFGNDDLLTSRIRNYKRMFERRVNLNFGVLYETPIEKLDWVATMVREVVEAQELVRFDRSHFKGFGESSLDFEAVYFVQAPEYAIMMDIQQRVNLEVSRRLAAEGIEFAFPTRTIHMAGGGGDPT